MLDSAETLGLLETGLVFAYNDVYDHHVEQMDRMDKEARACVRRIAKLWSKKRDSSLQRMSKTEDEHQKRTTELASLAEKAAKDRDALRRELENIKTSLPKDDEEVTELRRQLAQSEADLCALRASNSELSEKVKNLEEQLMDCVAYGEYLVESENSFLESNR
ncbi:hypothetical protein AAVH_24251, partial [Aphelenchoides avenae]